ncbi:MAG: hypothetical protein IJF92_03525 [Bacilli bacterium]|nr:hypothetical protein [Bacilli bacterium]
MNLSIVEKITEIFKYIGSSFLSVSLFILCLLLFLISVINISKKNKYANYIIIVIYLAIFISIIIASPSYFVYSIDWLLKSIMKYIYFPSTGAYYMINLFSIIIIIYSLRSKKISKAKKVFNFVICNILFYLFLAFVVLVTYNKLDIRILDSLYKNNQVLSIVQVSNLLLLLWIIITLFYKLFIFLKNKYDKKNENY